MNLLTPSSKPSTVWRNNAVMVQVLGVSPVLAVSDTLAKGIGLGLATALALVVCCLGASCLRGHLSGPWRLLVYLVILTATASAIDLAMQLVFFPLHRALGLYVPLICANAALLYRMETFANRVSLPAAFLDSLRTAGGILVTIMLLAALREWLATGKLFSQAELLLPFHAGSPYTGPLGTELSGYRFRFPVLQPGALLLFGALVAGVNWVRGKTTRNNNHE